MKKAYGYLRISTDGQEGEDKFGIPAQKESIEKYCADNDIEIVHWYTDTASGACSDRPDLDNLIDNLSSDIDYVIVAKCDRLARDVKLYFYYEMQIEKSGASVVSVSDDFSTFGEFAPLLKSFTVFVGAMERQNIMRRTSAGRNMKAKQGGYAGGAAPFGYTVQNSQLVIHEEEAKIVRSIYNARARGVLDYCTGIKKASYNNILEMLRFVGAKTKSGCEIGKSTLQRIFKYEPMYFGYYKYGNNGWVKGQHDPILTDKRLMSQSTRELLGIK